MDENKYQMLIRTLVSPIEGFISLYSQGTFGQHPGAIDAKIESLEKMGLNGNGVGLQYHIRRNSLELELVAVTVSSFIKDGKEEEGRSWPLTKYHQTLENFQYTDDQAVKVGMEIMGGVNVGPVANDVLKEMISKDISGGKAVQTKVGSHLVSLAMLALDISQESEVRGYELGKSR